MSPPADRLHVDEQDARIASGQLETAKLPVILFGADDAYLGPDLARHLAELFAKSDITIVPDASHWPQWDQPEAVARHLLALPT